MSIRGNTDFEYDLAVRQGNVRRLRTLIKHKVHPPQRMMLFALIRNHPELLDVLSEAGSDPNDEDGFNERALGRAINRYGVEVVEKLIKLGADPNKESLHLLPLIIAASWKKLAHIKALIAGGAEPNKLQWNGLTPLLAVVRQGELEATRILLDAGGDPTIKGPDGRDALEVARSLKRKDLGELLKSKLKALAPKSVKSGDKARNKGNASRRSNQPR